MQAGKKAIFLDIDGTLMASSAQPPSDEDIAALREARAQGHYVFINTGRALGFLPGVFKNADYLDGFLLGCGSHLILRGEDVFRYRLPEDCVRELLRYFLLHPEKKCVFEGEAGLYKVGGPQENWQYVIRSEEDFDARFASHAMTKITAFSNPDAIDRIVLAPWLELIEFECWYEGILHGCGKGVGLERVCAHLGIPVENSLAVGDSENDLDMFKHAGVSVAMANASPKAKAAADDITLPCGAGVAAAVRKWVLA